MNRKENHTGGRMCFRILLPVMLILLAATIIIGVRIGRRPIPSDSGMSYADETVGGEYILVVNGYDWGPGVDKLILRFDGKIRAENLEKAKFGVSLRYQTMRGSAKGSREVTGMYLCDAQGNDVNCEESEYIALEMSVHPDDAMTSPFYYDLAKSVNNWADPYDYTVTLTDGSKLIVDDEVFSAVQINTQIGTIFPDADVFNMYSNEYEGITLSYAAYEPKKLTEDSVKNALIIWLHGVGEGGTDPYITILGNRVTALAQEEIQSLFDGNGAYVLAPQSPTMWMDNGTGEFTTDGTSMYTESLMALIETYVSTHEDIDPNRIIIGGCSNGGYMTMNMIMSYPDYFAAAYPNCEAYSDALIADDMLKAIMEMPIWFTHAEVDIIVPIADYTDATYKRLIAMGAESVHYSRFYDVTGTLTDGSTYTFVGHWVWIYTLNNECKLDYSGTPVTLNGDEVTIWQWLAAQSK